MAISEVEPENVDNSAKKIKKKKRKLAEEGGQVDENIAVSLKLLSKSLRTAVSEHPYLY